VPGGETVKAGWAGLREGGRIAALRGGGQGERCAAGLAVA
jgi:hypothetical protein